MGMRNQMGMGEMGRDNTMRPPSQAGSDQYRIGDMDNRRNSGGMLINSPFHKIVDYHM